MSTNTILCIAVAIFMTRIAWSLRAHAVDLLPRDYDEADDLHAARG
jgi:hypothetical protein